MFHFSTVTCIEWAFRLPGDVLLPKGAPLKDLLRKICAEVYGQLPIASSKRGFVVPISAWLRGPLREVMEASLCTLRDSGLLETTGIDDVEEIFVGKQIASLVPIVGSCYSRVLARDAACSGTRYERDG